MKDRRRHRALSSATFALLLWLLPSAVRAQAAPAPSPAPAATQDADDPFAVLAAKPVQVPRQSNCEVRIVRPDGTPAADAIVVFVAESLTADTSPQRRAAALRWPGDEPRQLALLARDGERLAVGPGGEVMTPNYGRLYAFTREHATDRRVESIQTRLHLVAPHACTVEVVDEAGRPVAAAPIILRTAGTSLLLGRHTTGADGTLPLRLLLTQPQDCRIGPDVCSDTALDAPLPPVGGRVRLTMPKTTSLTAALADGSSLRRAQTCYLTSRGQKVRHYGELRGANRVVWPHVAIGSEFIATLELGPIGSAGRARWQPVATGRLSITGAANGHFELRSERPDRDAGESSTEFTIEPTWCFLGSSPWLATLRHGVTGQHFVVQRAIVVPLPDDLATPDLDALDIHVEATDGAGPSVAVAIDWQERRLLLPPGAWHFVVRADSKEVARWPNVRPGSADERRLAPFDWRSFARLVEVRVVDREGAPARDCRVHLRERWLRACDSNVVRILAPHAGVALDIQASGHKGTLALADVAENRTVRVGPRPRLRVVLRPPPERPPGVVLELVVGGGGGDGDAVSFNEHFTADLHVESVGPITPTVRVRSGGPRPVTVDWPLPRIDVTKQGATLTFEVTPAHQRALEQAIERARPR